MLSQRLIENAIREARTLRVDRIELHIAPSTLRECRPFLTGIIARQAHTAQEVTLAKTARFLWDLCRR